jgi:hypothetical protein
MSLKMWFRYAPNESVESHENQCQDSNSAEIRITCLPNTIWNITVTVTY